MAEPASYLLSTGDEGAALAREYEVTADIHLDDPLFGHLRGAHGQDLEAALRAYLDSGRTSALKIRDLLAQLQGAKIVDGRIAERMTILDFAAGYGCVARHFRNVIPEAKVVTIDFEDKAMYFNTAHLGVQAAVADANPARVNPFFQFDLVYAVSFFTRMPRDRIGPWLEKLAQFAKAGGLVVFTTHGTATHRDHLPHIAVNEEGFGYERTSGQRDLDERGHAITYPRLVFKEIARLRNVDPVLFQAAAWWGHQDLYVVRKTA